MPILIKEEHEAQQGLRKLLAEVRFAKSALCDENTLSDFSKGLHCPLQQMFQLKAPRNNWLHSQSSSILLLFFLDIFTLRTPYLSISSPLFPKKTNALTKAGPTLSIKVFTFISSHSCLRVKQYVQAQGISGVDSPEASVERLCFKLVVLNMASLALYFDAGFCVFPFLCSHFSSCKEGSHSWLQTILMTSFDLIIYVKILFPK